jgi:NAD(P)-dependent dehydrogenase (short-subunit alcohol dehydrogenase family)
VSDPDWGRPDTRFAGQGYAVALLSRSSETSTRVAEEIVGANGKALVVQTDVTRLESVNNAVKKVRSELEPITALAYDASGYGRGGFLELDPKNNPTIFRGRRHGRRLSQFKE